MRRILIVLIAAFAVPLAAARAQRAISGVVFDSLRSQSPIANGEVILVGTGRRTRRG